MEPLSFRIVRHDLPDGSAHFDVFLLTPEDPLPTLELADAPQLRKLLADGGADVGGPWVARAVVGGDAGFSAVRKADHRGIYREYQGPISGGRGEIREVGRGRWEAAVPENPGDSVWISLESLPGIG